MDLAQCFWQRGNCYGSITDRIIVEFKKINDEQYKKRLDSLPRAISKTEVTLRYYNSPIHGQELKCLKELNPISLMASMMIRTI
jgi:hypothetical protein